MCTRRETRDKDVIRLCYVSSEARHVQEIPALAAHVYPPYCLQPEGERASTADWTSPFSIMATPSYARSLTSAVKRLKVGHHEQQSWFVLIHPAFNHLCDSHTNSLDTTFASSISPTSPIRTSKRARTYTLAESRTGHIPGAIKTTNTGQCRHGLQTAAALIQCPKPRSLHRLCIASSILPESIRQRTP